MKEKCAETKYRMILKDKLMKKNCKICKEKKNNVCEKAKKETTEKLKK